MKQLLNTAQFIGRVEWIGFAAASRGPIVQYSEALLVQGGGIEGDHYCKPTRQSKRQVTLIQAEHLPIVATLLGQAGVAPELLRRNIVVSGINLASLRHQRFSIGDAVLLGSGTCPPCSRMEENLGQGGYAAILGHGGITAIVEKAARIKTGSDVRALEFAGLGGASS